MFKELKERGNINHIKRRDAKYKKRHTLTFKR